MAPPGFPAGAPEPWLPTGRAHDAPASMLHKVDAVPRTAVYVRNVIPPLLSAIFRGVAPRRSAEGLPQAVFWLRLLPGAGCCLAPVAAWLRLLPGAGC